MASTASSLVLGCAYGLPAKAFEAFVRSLRATGYRGRLALVLGNYEAAELRDIASLADAVIVTTDEYEPVNALLVATLRTVRAPFRRRGCAYPLLFKLAALGARGRNVLSRGRALEYNLEGLIGLRHAHYYDIVRGAADVDQVFLTDLRDVVFQRDPFEPVVSGLEVFLEPALHTLSREPFNRAMIRRLYGKSEVAAIGDHVASCAGTVIGRRADILRYLREMSQEVARRGFPLGAFDQGVHNHLLRRGRLGDVTIVENGRGRVLTMNGMSRISRGEDGRVLNADGSVPAVLHQYDRFPSLATELVAGLELAG